MNPKLTKLLKEAKTRIDNMTEEEYREHFHAQKQSYVRGMMATCEHGIKDFEQCPKCRGWQ